MVKPIDRASKGDESPKLVESSSETKVVGELQSGFAEALQVQGQEYLSRAACDAVLQKAFNELPEIDQRKIIEVLEKRGLLPNATTGKRAVEGLSEDRQNLLKNPDGLLHQCIRLSHGATSTAKLLQLPENDERALAIAGALINSGKAKQFVALEDAESASGNLSPEHKAVLMLTTYNANEHADCAELEILGVFPEATALLRENVRHDPSAPKTFSGKLLYYILYSQDPQTGQLVNVEQRVNASIHKHPIYGQIYAGYSVLLGKDLITEHQRTIGEIEKELEQQLRAKGHQFTDLKSFLNEKINQG